jgi:hypothetical protein
MITKYCPSICYNAPVTAELPIDKTGSGHGGGDGKEPHQKGPLQHEPGEPFIVSVPMGRPGLAMAILREYRKKEGGKP